MVNIRGMWSKLWEKKPNNISIVACLVNLIWEYSRVWPQRSLTQFYQLQPVFSVNMSVWFLFLSPHIPQPEARDRAFKIQAWRGRLSWARTGGLTSLRRPGSPEPLVPLAKKRWENQIDIYRGINIKWRFLQQLSVWQRIRRWHRFELQQTTRKVVCLAGFSALAIVLARKNKRFCLTT